MRILFPTSEFPPMGGGVAALAYREAEGLARNGAQLKLLLPQQAEGASLPGSKIVTISNSDRAIKRLFPFIKAVKHHAKHADIIYTPTYRGFGLPCLVARITCKIPYAVYLHGTEIFTELKSVARRLVMERVLQKAAFVATNSYNTRQIVLDSFRIPPTQVHAIHPGADVVSFVNNDAQISAQHLRKRLLEQVKATGTDPVLFVTIARMSREKGVHLVLDAFSKLLHEKPNASFYYILVGDGPALEDFKSQATRLGLRERCLFCGKVPLGDVPPYYLASDVYVQPSQDEGDFLESFGISFIEAQAAGLPCIGSDWGGVPEAVKKNETALLAPLGDVNAIKDQMVKLGNDKELRVKMGLAGRIHASAFTWDSHVTQLHALLSKALEKSHK